MSDKNKHFISIVTPLAKAVVVDMDLSREEYELVNRISTLFVDVADANDPILVVSQPIPDLTAADDTATLPPVSEDG